MGTPQNREQKVETLARTLRASGLALSDSQARKMAEDMIGTEERVQVRYQEQHQRAHEILDQSKTRNLSTPVEGNTQANKPHAIDNKDRLKSEIVQEMRERAIGKPHDHKEHTDIPIAQKIVDEVVNTRAQTPIPSSAETNEAQKLIDEPAQEVPAYQGANSTLPAQEPVAEPREQVISQVASSAPNFEEEPAPLEPELPTQAPSAPEEIVAQAQAPPPAEEEDEESRNQPERTRVYSDKIANPKPIEEFEESKVDLSAIFSKKR